METNRALKQALKYAQTGRNIRRKYGETNCTWAIKPNPAQLMKKKKKKKKTATMMVVVVVVMMTTTIMMRIRTLKTYICHCIDA
jgi:hypothetical protein